MKRILSAWPWKTAFGLLIGAWSSSARSEITLDGSLGGASGRLAGPEFQIGANLGRQVGSNLFHSFGVFDVNTGESATFNDVGASGLVENILSRVTGRSASNIDGMLGTDFANTTPNLFLLNPAGVVFGPHASLDVQGSFHVSTADFIELADGARFDALPTTNDALLSSAAPAAFGFLDGSIAPIQVLGGSLDAKGKSLSLTGGGVELKDGATLKAPGGRINITSLASAGKVKLDNIAFEAESSGPLGGITMQGSTIDVNEALGSDSGAGSVFIRGGRFMVDNSKVLANTVNGDGGGIEMELSEVVGATNGSSFEARTSGPGNGGDLNIQAKEILLEGGSKLDACSAKSGGCLDRGDVCLSCGDAGDVAIKTGRLQLTRGSRINANTQGSGNGGNVTINASEEVVLADDSQVQASARLRGEGGPRRAVLGNGGNIVIDTGRLELNRGGNISALTSGDKKGGVVKITAKDVLLKGRSDRGGFSTLAATTDTGSGEGGEITINTDRLSLADGATIRALSNGPGKGGNITIEANDIVLEGGSELRVEAERRSSGDAGNLAIKTGRLQLAGGSRIEAGTQGPGNGGGVMIDATGQLRLSDRSNIRAETSGSGSGGKIEITAGNIELQDGSRISSQSTSALPNAGRSGEIFFRALDSLRLFNDSHISVETAQADAGDINLDVGFLLHLRDNSSITTSVAGGQGDGGNIRIDPVFVILDNSDIIANARQGQAGNIRIVSDFFFASPGSIVRASNDRNIQGVVEIESPDTDLNAGLVELPADFFDVATLLTHGCAPGASLSRLVVRKYEVLPDSPAALRVPPPGGLLSADAPNEGVASTHEPPGLGFEHSSACGGEG